MGNEKNQHGKNKNICCTMTHVLQRGRWRWEKVGRVSEASVHRHRQQSLHFPCPLVRNRNTTDMWVPISTHTLGYYGFSTKGYSALSWSEARTKSFELLVAACQSLWMISLGNPGLRTYSPFNYSHIWQLTILTVKFCRKTWTLRRHKTI